VSASRRTDIPAFHAAWFRERLAAGFCDVLHPFTGRISRVSLLPRDVLAFVFWTRQPGPLLPTMEALRDAGSTVLVHFTINGYGPPIESHNPPRDVAIRAFRRASEVLGPDAVMWRYDPIVLGMGLSRETHFERFTSLARELEGATRRCTFSFVDFYGKTTRNLGEIERARGERFERPGEARKFELSQELGEIARMHGMSLRSCCDDALVGEHVAKSRCIDPEVIESVRGATIGCVPPRPTRKDCGCVASVDIGAYDSCAFGCAYCYAVGKRDRALQRLAGRDSKDPLLCRPAKLA
jgi:hypothetical protein